jgi:hypothetical protein
LKERKKEKKKKGKEGKGKRKRKGREYLEKNLRFYFEEDRIQRRWYVVVASAGKRKQTHANHYASTSASVGQQLQTFSTFRQRFASGWQAICKRLANSWESLKKTSRSSHSNNKKQIVRHQI